MTTSLIHNNSQYSGKGRYNGSKGNLTRNSFQSRRVLGTNITLGAAQRSGLYDFDMVFKSLSVCHSTKSRRDRVENAILNEFSHPLDKALVDFAERNDYKFQSVIRNNNITYYKVRIKELTSLYPIVGINEFTRKRNKMSIVLREPGRASGSSLYVKGYDKSMIDNLNLLDTERDNLKDFIEETLVYGFMVGI
jgi:magnesium-transporting ATPase (P-type)